MEPFIAFLGATVVIAVVLLLPAIIELKKPKDLGPRKIVGFKKGTLLQSSEPSASRQPVADSLTGIDSLINLEV